MGDEKQSPCGGLGKIIGFPMDCSGINADGLTKTPGIVLGLIGVTQRLAWLLFLLNKLGLVLSSKI